MFGRERGARYPRTEAINKTINNGWPDGRHFEASDAFNQTVCILLTKIERVYPFMSFPFVPRKFAKAQKQTSEGVASTTTTPVASTSHISSSFRSTTDSKGKGKFEEKHVSYQKTVNGKSKYTDADYVNLICLALSDYALWSDTNLRQKIDFSGDGEHGGGEGQRCTSKFLSK